MLQKVLVKMKCLSPGTVNGHAGAELHAMFLKAVSDCDPELGRAIHDQQVKPFAIGPLTGKMSRKDGLASVEVGESYVFSIATLSNEMSAALPVVLDRIKEGTVSVANSKLQVEEINYLLKSGLTYFKLMSDCKLKEKLSFQFVSPTCFRRDGQLILFPMTGHIFNGLVERWDHFSDVPMPIFNVENLRASRYELKTSMVAFNSYSLIGFRGKCEYVFMNGTQEIDRWPLCVLSDFASIAGVGYKTTMGMGQVRLR